MNWVMKQSGRAGAKATSAADGGQDTTPGAIRSVLGILLSKVPGIEVLHLKDKGKKIRCKGGLPTDCSKGLEGYAHAEGGIAVMPKVRSNHRLIRFTVSIDLKDEDLTFEVKPLQCLEDKDNIIILFAYGAAARQGHTCTKDRGVAKLPTPWRVQSVQEGGGEPK